jgi:hypothetical protein
MPKNMLQDVIPPGKRSIRNIPVPQRPQRNNGGARPPEPQNDAGPQPPQPPLPPEIQSYNEFKEQGPRHSSKKTIWFAVGVALVIIIIFILSLFESATVKIYPKQQIISATGQALFADKDGADNTVPFEVIKISKDQGMSVNATGEKDVEQKASGKIVIYNNFDSNNQRLIKNTRFETSEGLIYRIDESAVVPGQQIKNGEKVPGSIEVTVFADEPGEKYNIGLVDFTIPGFKGDPRYEKIYARSKTEMTGGFVGKMKTVSENDLASAQNSLHAALQDELIKEIQSQLPDSFVLVNDGFFFSFKSLPQSNVAGDTVQVNEEGTLDAIVFNKSLLANYLASQFASSLPSGGVHITDIGNLPIIITNKKDFNPGADTSFEFTIDGQVILVADIDEEAIKKDLAGQSKKDMNSILANYVAIEKAQPFIRPVWKGKFPKNEKNIKIEVITTTSTEQ